MKFEDKVKLLREKKHKGKESTAFLQDVVRMAEGEALEYLLGGVTFCDALIDLTYRPMIPRPEAVYWMNQLLHGLREGDDDASNKELRALDLFSGSGCLGFALLKNVRGSVCTFVDSMPSFVEQLEKTVLSNKIDKERVRILQQESSHFLSHNKEKFDIVLAVPPYVPPALKDEVMTELRAESESFFFDKEDGYYYHKQVLDALPVLLTDGGVLYLEFDVTQREEMEKLVQERGYTRYSFLKDPYGNECVVRLTKL